MHPHLSRPIAALALTFTLGACASNPIGDAAPDGGSDASATLDARVDGTAMDTSSLSDASADANVDVTVDAGPPAVRIIGRTDESDATGPSFEWSGTSIVARFTGTSVSVRLHDYGNFYRVAIDGTALPTLLHGSATTTTYPLATGLTAGIHTVELWRRTEAFANPTQFLGFDFGTDGALLPPPPRARHRIELIGDSISCGYGDEGTSSACHFSLDTENHYASYGAITARALDAELFTLAWSGYGMYRGYAGDTTQTLPSLYDRAIPTLDTSTWNFSSWTPEAVVINLGTNDYAQGDPGQAYTDAYIAFLARIRSHYPDAYILASIGPTHAPGPRIMAAIAARQAAGDTHLGYLEYTVPDNQFGCDYHPNLIAQAAMADQLTTALRTALGW